MPHKLFSFLGLATNYSTVEYTDPTSQTVLTMKFSLEAILALTPNHQIGEIYIIHTEASETFIAELKCRLADSGLWQKELKRIAISNNEDVEQFWQNFENINAKIQDKVS